MCVNFSINIISVFNSLYSVNTIGTVYQSCSGFVNDGLVVAKKKRKKSLWRLGGGPQSNGIVERVIIERPRNPNSANRNVASISLCTGVKVRAFIMGIGHDLESFNQVLIRGGSAKDLSGINYSIIRNNYGHGAVENSSSRRSLYGVSNIR